MSQPGIEATGHSAIKRNIYAIYDSLAMLAGMQLDVFTPLGGGPKNASQLAEYLQVQESKLSPLLYALVVAGLLTVEETNFSNTEESSQYLVRDSESYLGDMGDMFAKLWEVTMLTAYSIRTESPQAKFDYSALDKDGLINFFKRQYPSGLRTGKELAQKIDFSKSKRLLDAGGGAGGLSIALCQAYPDLQATIAELPSVAPISTSFVSEAGMSDRVDVMAVNLVENPVEGFYDTAVLRSLLQVLPPDHARNAIKNIAQAISPGGTLYVVGCILENSRLAPIASVAFNLVFLNVYDEGRSYTEEEHRSWLLEAGFTDIAIAYETMSDGFGILTARKA